MDLCVILTNTLCFVTVVWASSDRLCSVLWRPSCDQRAYVWRYSSVVYTLPDTTWQLRQCK